MPIHYTLDVARGVVRIGMTGVVGPADTLLLAFGAIRQFAALAARAAVEVRPFLDPREAERWLALPEALQ